MKLRAVGIRRNEPGKAPKAVMWRCDVHHRLNHPDFPDYACGCESPLSKAVLKDTAEMRAFRAMKWQEDTKVRGRPPRRLDYDVIRAMSGTGKSIAAAVGCTEAMVSLIRRGTR